MPDGSVSTVFPFHVGLEGMEALLLCRDNEDFDHLEKSFYLGALDSNALVISEIDMSTHGHCAVLAVNWEGAAAVGEFVKKRHSQYMAKKYGERSVMARTRVSVQYLDSDQYLLEALAYIPRNAVDAGYRIEDYPWSSFRGMFASGEPVGRAVSSLPHREKERLFRTHKDLSQVPWMLDGQDRIIPTTACDCAYVESAFGGNRTFYLRLIGEVNPDKMWQKLVLNSRTWQNDARFLVSVADVAGRWFRKEVPALDPAEKTRLVIYLYRSYYTSVSQLSRCLQLRREDVRRTLWEHDIRPRE